MVGFLKNENVNKCDFYIVNICICSHREWEHFFVFLTFVALRALHEVMMFVLKKVRKCRITLYNKIALSHRDVNVGDE